MILSHEVNLCTMTGKLKFRSKRLAKLVGNRKSKVHDKKFDHYRCQYCEFWHLTTRVVYRRKKSDYFATTP